MYSKYQIKYYINVKYIVMCLFVVVAGKCSSVSTLIIAFSRIPAHQKVSYGLNIITFSHPRGLCITTKERHQSLFLFEPQHLFQSMFCLFPVTLLKLLYVCTLFCIILYIGQACATRQSAAASM